MHGTYSVVVCPNCQQTWIVEDRPERTNCPQCDKSHQFSKLRVFHEADSTDEARRARTKVQAHVNGMEEEYEQLAEAGDLTTNWEDTPTTSFDVSFNTASQSSQSDRDIVLEAVTDQDTPDEAAVVAYATNRGVDEEKTRMLVEKLERGGEVMHTDDGYRTV